MPRMTTIKVPVELRDEMKRVAEKKGVALWELIAQAWSIYRSKVSEGFGDKSNDVKIDMQKAAYYIMKLSYSVTKFKENPSKENYDWLVKTAEQIESRLGVDLSLLKRIAEQYRRVQDKQTTYELNMAWKNAIMSIMSLVC